jgi:predicted transposase YdaD
MLRLVLPPPLVARINWSTLVLCPSSFIDEVLTERHGDLLFTALVDGHPVFFLLVEHQSTVEVLMGFGSCATRCEPGRGG